MKTSFSKGVEYEDKACEFLLSKGFVILDRRFKTKYGEIDIVCKRENNDIAHDIKKNNTHVHVDGDHIDDVFEDEMHMHEVNMHTANLHEVHFVEVKFRQFHKEYSVNDRQCARVGNAAQIWLMEHEKYAKYVCIFDVILFDHHEMLWLENAFTIEY